MTEAEWLTADRDRLAGWLGRFPERQRLLFICACAGLVNPLFPEECPAAINYITEIADGLRSMDEFNEIPRDGLSEDRHPLRTIRYARDLLHFGEERAGGEAARAIGSVAGDQAYFRTREMSFESDWRDVRASTAR